MREVLYCGDEVPQGTRLVSLPYTFKCLATFMVWSCTLSHAVSEGQAPTHTFSCVKPATWRSIIAARRPHRGVNITHCRRTLGAATSARSDIFPIPICLIGTFYINWVPVLWQNVWLYVVRVARINVPDQQSKEGKKNHLHVHVVRVRFVFLVGFIF